MRYALLIGGLMIIAGLWGIAAARIAPAMESEVQRKGERLLAVLDYSLETRADGLLLSVSGEIPDRSDRFTVRDRLNYLHPIVQTQLDLVVVEDAKEEVRPESTSIRRWKRPDRSQDEDVGDMEVEGDGSSNCELLQMLDPGLVCAE